MSVGVNLSAQKFETDELRRSANLLLPTRKYLLVAGLAFLIFYLPFFFGPSHTYIRIHDNLDSDAVYNTVIGIFYLHPAEAKHLLLAGNLPIYLIHRVAWPVSLLYVISDRFLAYTLNDLLVLRPLDYVTKLVSGPLAGELPLYGNPVAIHTTIPGPGLLAQASDVSDSAFA